MLGLSERAAAEWMMFYSSFLAVSCSLTFGLKSPSLQGKIPSTIIIPSMAFSHLKGREETLDPSLHP